MLLSHLSKEILQRWQFNNQEDAHELPCGILKSLEDADIR